VTRDELIAAMKADGAETPIAVDVPKWGRVYVRFPSVAEAEVQKPLPEGEADLHTLARAAALVLCDEKGERMFDPLNADDIALLSARRAADLQKIISAGRESGN
jgi:hypothetical protein